MRYILKLVISTRCLFLFFAGIKFMTNYLNKECSILIVKRIFLTFFTLFMISGCVGMAVTTTNVTEKVTGTVRSIDEINSDKKLEKVIEKQLKQDVKMFAEINNMRRVGEYDITAYEGRILVTGRVADPRMKNFIYNKIWDFKGVKEVINELEISQEKSGSINDYFLSKSVKNRLRFTSGIRSVNYKVIVYNKKAFILGVAYSDDEMRKVGYITGTTNGIKNAIIHVININDPRRK